MSIKKKTKRSGVESSSKKHSCHSLSGVLCLLGVLVSVVVGILLSASSQFNINTVSDEVDPTTHDQG